MYLHFRCVPCKRVYALQADANRSVKSRAPTPDCRSCNQPTSASGFGARKLRSGAILLTAAALSRTAGRMRQAAVRTAAKRDALVSARRAAQRRGDQDSSDESDEELLDDDDEFLPTPNVPFNIRMRLTQAPYVARSHYSHDAGCVLMATRSIYNTAGRLDLNLVMGKHMGHPAPRNYPAWRYVGSTAYSINRFDSSEWCHLVADSLGGPSEPGNLVAASFSANTYMAALEALLKGQSALSLTVTAHCSAPNLGERIFYRIHHRQSGKIYDQTIDARAPGFNAANLTNVQTNLQAWLAARGIHVNLSP